MLNVQLHTVLCILNLTALTAWRFIKTMHYCKNHKVLKIILLNVSVALLRLVSNFSAFRNFLEMFYKISFEKNERKYDTRESRVVRSGRADVTAGNEILISPPCRWKVEMAWRGEGPEMKWREPLMLTSAGWLLKWSTRKGEEVGLY